MQANVNLVIKMKYEKNELHKVGELTPVKSPFFSYSSGVLPEAFAFKERWKDTIKKNATTIKVKMATKQATLWMSSLFFLKTPRDNCFQTDHVDWFDPQGSSVVDILIASPTA